MKPCPLCRDKGNVHRDAGMTGCTVCHLMAPDASWDALPRVREDAEALVDAYGVAEWMHRTSAGSYDIHQKTRDTARAELLRACVVDAAEVAALRAQRDEAINAANHEKMVSRRHL